MTGLCYGDKGPYAISWPEMENVIEKFKEEQNKTTASNGTKVEKIICPHCRTSIELEISGHLKGYS